MNSIDAASEPEFFAVACPKCAAALAVSDDLVGDLAVCPICDGRFLVPESELPPPPPPPPAVRDAAATGDSAATQGSTAAAEDPAWQQMATTLTESVAQPAERHRDMEFREPALTVETEEGTHEIRRLTDEEKRIRRSRRNLMMLLAGTVILIVITTLLGRDKPKKR